MAVCSVDGCHSMTDESNVYWHNGHQHCRACRHTHSVKQAAARKAARHLAKS